MLSEAAYSALRRISTASYILARRDGHSRPSRCGPRSSPPSSSQTSLHFTYPGTTPGISAQGTANGIVWAVENGSTAVLHAYDATDLSKELYNSTQAGSRDSFGAGNKFITLMIAGGKVFVGTPNGVAVFGLLQ